MLDKKDSGSKLQTQLPVGLHGASGTAVVEAGQEGAAEGEAAVLGDAQ
jgi:hypothetical protein